MAGYRKKRERELKSQIGHVETVKKIEAVGKKLEGKGRTILIVLIAVAVVAAGALFLYRRSARKADEARAAMGAALKIHEAKVSATPEPGSTDPTYPTDKERAEKAIVAFQDVANRFGEPYHTNALYFIAVNRLVTERPKGLSELDALTKNGDASISTLAKYALAQAKEADGDLAGAGALYADLVKLNNPLVSADTANIALANVLNKQGKKQEASDILFKIASDGRVAKDAEGLPKQPTGTSRAAADKLQKIDPDRYAQLPPEPPPPGGPMGGGLPIG